MAVKRQREKDERTREEEDFRERKLAISDKAGSLDRTFQHLLDATGSAKTALRTRFLEHLCSFKGDLRSMLGELRLL